jgi:SWI/SNF-related matrix-associated actin-dependent regulator of chromatin subfamily A3
MNKRTHLALASLPSVGTMKFTAIITQSEFQQKLARAAASTGAKLQNIACAIAILVFGSQSLAETLANDLSKRNLFLQHPYPMPPDVAYKNPQYLEIVGSSFSNGDILPPISVETPGQDTNSSHDFDGNEALDLAGVIDNLPRNDYLKEADADVRISSKLLR